MVFFFAFFALLMAIVFYPSVALANPTSPPAPNSRRLRMLEAANAISVMLFSDNFESLEIGEKALGTIAKPIDADFIELWKNQGKDEHATCTQIYWWERNNHKTHFMETKTITYSGIFSGWLEKLKKDKVILITQSTPNGALFNELAYHQTACFFVIPIFFENSLWGFLRLGLPSAEDPLTKNEQNILRSIGLFLVASLHRHKTQKALKASEERFKDITLAKGEIVWELDANGYFSYISSRISEIAGYSYEYFIGKRWEEFSTAMYSDVTSQLFQAAITENIIDNFEHAIVTKEGKTLWLHSAAKLLVDTVGVAGLRGTSFDYTQSRETAQKLEDTLQALQRSNYELEQAVQHAYTLAEKAHSANTAKENFLSNISHEIRTPLNSIAGMTYLLEQSHLTDKQESYVSKIKDASSALVTIVDNIIDFTNIQTGTVEKVLSQFRITDFFQEVATLFSAKLTHKNIYGLFAIAKNVPINLRGDVLSLRQIITNLLDNGIKFTDSGAVSLTCALVNQKQTNDIILQFTIRDTGIGIPKDQQDQMLEAFTQKDASTTRRFGGTGLGLTIAHQLIHLNGGTFSLESAPHKGTTIHFTFILPPLTGPATPIAFPLNQRFGVVVEDPSDYLFFTDAMEDAGFFVDTITINDLTAITRPENARLSSITTLCIPVAILQRHPQQLEDFFTIHRDTFPTVVAFSPKPHLPLPLPHYVTHISTGPIMVFLPPPLIGTALKKNNNLSHATNLTAKERLTVLEKLTDIIALLNDSDADGRSKFNEIKSTLVRVDEKNTGKINNLLEIFQFTEAVPLLTTLRENIAKHV